MKQIISFVLISFMCSFAILSATEILAPFDQSREELYIMIKEELQLTVDIQSTQNQVLMIMLNLNQKNLAQKNITLSNQIENLRVLKLYEGKSDESQMAMLQAQLDSTRVDLKEASATMQQLRDRMKQSEQKILDYYGRINKYAQNLIMDVEGNKNPKLPGAILKTMKHSYGVMSQATVAKGMDQKEFDSFQVAAEDYIKFLAANGKDTKKLNATMLTMSQYNKSATANQMHYNDLQIQFANYQKMLDSEINYNYQLQKKLDDLKTMAAGIPYDDKIYFESASVKLDRTAVDVLLKFAASTPPNEDYNILVTGYSDNTPIGGKLQKKYASNWELSLARSSAVVNYLLVNLRFPPEKIIIAGKGEYPADANAKPLGKEQSRRVEFRFVPKTK